MRRGAAIKFYPCLGVAACDGAGAEKPATATLHAVYMVNMCLTGLRLTGRSGLSGPPVNPLSFTP